MVEDERAVSYSSVFYLQFCLDPVKMNSSLDRYEPGSIKFRLFARQSYVYDSGLFEKIIGHKVDNYIWKC